jgi:AAHS family 4-hydroxybenzoate transporter-like MFS transporter
MSDVIDVAEMIDRQKIGNVQIRIILLCGLVQFLDGFDTQAIAYVAPTLSQAWGLDRSALGPVFGAGIAGILLGSLLIGPLADRFGRKTLMIVAVALFGILTLLTARAENLTELITFRFLAGIGLGGVIPSTVVIASEFAPRKRRATMVTLMACGFALGAASGGILVSHILPYGWETIFYIGGVLPLFLVVALAIWMPESLRFLLLAGKDSQRIVRVLKMMDKSFAPTGDVRFALPTTTIKGNSVLGLFAERRALVTCLLWIAFFLNLFSLNFLNNWLPTVISSKMSVQDAVRTTTWFQFGGIVGVIAMGILADRFGFYRVLVAAFLVASATTACIGFSETKESLTIILLFCGFCTIGVQQNLSALSATLYPTPIRTTGTGWASGIGRIGSFAGPVVGGLLLALHPSTQNLFVVIAGPTLAGALCIFLLGQRMDPPRRSDVVVSLPSA